MTSNYRQLYCLFNSLFRLIIKKTSTLRPTGLLCRDRWHKGSVMRGTFPWHDVIMSSLNIFEIRFFSQQYVHLLKVQYIPRNMHTVFALLCFVVVIHWLIFPYPSGLLHWHCGNLTIAPVPAKQPWWIWINTSCEYIMNDCITTTKQSTTKPCAYFLG